MPTYRNDGSTKIRAGGQTWLPGETKTTKWPHHSVYDANLTKTSDDPIAQVSGVLTIGDVAVSIPSGHLSKSGRSPKTMKMTHLGATGSVIFKTDGGTPLVSSSGETGDELLAGNSLEVEDYGQIERWKGIRSYGSGSGEIYYEIDYT